MPTDRSRTWDGGYIRTDSKGRNVYYIRRRISGRLYDVSTRATTSKAAHQQLQRFEADPDGYKPSGELDGDASLALAAAFLKWSRNEKGNTQKWVDDQQRSLTWWAEQIGAADLRKVKGSELARALDKAETSRKQHIATIKTFCGWLTRERRTMEAKDDPTTGLQVPQSRPEQWTDPKTFTPDQFEAVREHLSGTWLDCADVLAGTGKHAAELGRFVLGTDRGQRGRVGVHPQTVAPVLAFPQTKGGDPGLVEVSQHVADAAARLLTAGVYDYFDFRDALRTACKAAGLEVDTVSPGNFRHSVGTWGVNSGANLAAVSAFLGHKSVQTTKRFYATHAVPAKVPTIK